MSVGLGSLIELEPETHLSKSRYQAFLQLQASGCKLAHKALLHRASLFPAQSPEAFAAKMMSKLKAAEPTCHNIQSGATRQERPLYLSLFACLFLLFHVCSCPLSFARARVKGFPPPLPFSLFLPHGEPGVRPAPSPARERAPAVLGCLTFPIEDFL